MPFTAKRSLAKRLRLAALAAPPPQRPARTPDHAVQTLAAWAVGRAGEEATHLVLKITTGSGLTGWGEARAGADPPHEAARLAALQERLAGHDALAVGVIERLLADVPAAHRAAVDLALLDIAGKAMDAPVYQILTGRTRDKVRGVARLASDDDLDRARDAGFRAFSLPVDVPGGFVRGRAFYTDTFDRLERLRREGEDFALDCGGRTTAGEAAALAARFERFRLLWMDEPAPEINEEALRKIAGESVTPLGWGARLEDNGELQDLFRMQVIDVFRPDLTYMGLSRARRGAALAEAYYTAVAPWHAGGPIGVAAGVQLAAATPNAFAVDVPIPVDDAAARLRRDIAGGGSLETPTDGFLELPDGPGLGIEVDEDAVNRHGRQA